MSPTQAVHPSSIAISGLKLSVLGVLAVYSTSRPILLVGLASLLLLSLAVPFLRPYPLRTKVLLGGAISIGPLVGGTLLVLLDGSTLNMSRAVLAVSVGMASLLFTRYRVRQGAQ